MSEDRCPACGGSHPGKACAALRTQLAATQETLLSGGDAGPAPELVDLAPGTLVGEYRVVEQVGVGGMGVVYSGIHPLIGRKVAIKVINVAGGGASAAARFLLEARAATLVRHRNIVDVFAFGQLHDGRSYLVMEFLEGESLAAYLRRKGPLSFARALPILDGICAGLQAAHDKGIIHRDLKPDNIWVGIDGDGAAPGNVDAFAVKILDFGLAKLVDPDGAGNMVTRAGVPLGTPAFMSPEQCRGERDIDHRSDIYALGVVMYQMYAQEVPFDGASYVEVLHLHLSAPPPSLADAVGMPEELDAIIHRAMAKRPADRFQSVAELLAAVHGCAAARDWAPIGGNPPRASSGDDLLPVTVHHSDLERAAAVAADRLPSLDAEGFRAAPTLDGDTLTLRLAGELDDPSAVQVLGSYLGQLTESMEARVRRVVLDFESLQFLGSDGVACVTEWLALLRELRSEGLAPTTIRYSEAIPWQRVALPGLRRVDPGLRFEISE